MKTVFALIAILIGFSTAQAQTPVKEWTFLVYLNADNDLYRFGIRNLQQMQKVGSNQNLNIVVEFDHAPRQKPTQRLLVLPNQEPQVLSTQPETDMGDWQHLAEFVSWGVQNFPAKRYALIIWNHGAGWEGISYDDNPSNYMTIPAVAQALRQATANVSRFRPLNGPLIDILNFDACLMSGLETAFELKDLAKIMVGSQYNEPGEGEDYTAILSLLAQKPQTEPRALAEHMVYEYVRQFPKSREINYLALDLSKVGGFTQLFRGSAAHHVKSEKSVQTELRRFYGSSLEGDDLVGGLVGARQRVAGNQPFAAALDQVINAYGYPAESANQAGQRPGFAFRNGGLQIKRAYPATVAYRMSAGAPWKQAPLRSQGDGTYAVDLPRVAQYVVRRSVAEGRQEGIGFPEAVATFLRNDQDPVIFHNQFPATSPVIAEAHNSMTKGATGLSLYYNSSGRAMRDRGPRAGQALASEYLNLQFAKVGAPEWTQFIGAR